MTDKLNDMHVHDILKLNREKRRLSLVAIHQETKISINYLQAMESGQWKLFPADVYLKGSLRRYASYLGLNPDEMIALYNKETEPEKPSAEKVPVKEQVQDDTDAESGSSFPDTQEEGGNDSQIFVRVLIFILFVAAIGGWYVYTVMKSPRPEAKKTEPTQMASKLSRSAFVQSEDLLLGVKATSAVWVRVAADKKLLFEGFLSSGSLRTYNAKEEFVLRVGNTLAVNLTLNNYPIDVSRGAKQDVNEMVLTHRSLLDESLLIKSTGSVNAHGSGTDENRAQHFEQQPPRARIRRSTSAILSQSDAVDNNSPARKAGKKP